MTQNQVVSFLLQTCIDFRPTCEDITGASTTLSNIDEITGDSLISFIDSLMEQVQLQLILHNQIVLYKQILNFILVKIFIFLTPKGEFKIIEGQSAERPNSPKDIDNAMKLADLSIPPFTFRPDDVTVTRLKTQRFTMRDIGRLQDRIENLEFSALNLLERDAESFEIQDANGLNRFKSGFVVDNFSGHRLGKTQDKDYKCAIDMVEKELRPKCVLKNAPLKEVATTDAQRTTKNYQKTGDLITLPYTHTHLQSNNLQQRQRMFNLIYSQVLLVK